MTEDFKIRQIQERTLKLLKRFHEVCVNNQICYSLHGGTLLGAIREKGFISWDDDADVSMFRPEFEKFQKILKNSGKYYGLKLIYHINQIPIVLFQEETEDSVFIDLFIYDRISQNRMCQKIKISILIGLDIFSKPKGALSVRKSIYRFPGWMRILYDLVYLLGQPFPRVWRIKLANWFAKNSFCGKGQLVHRSNDQYIGIGLILPALIVERYQMVEFEKTELMVFEDYRTVLISSYGENYMIPRKYSDDNSDVHDMIREYIRQKNYKTKKCKDGFI